MANHPAIKNVRFTTAKGFRIRTEVGNFLYLTGEGFPRWRDEEYSTLFKTRAEAQDVIDGCGYKHDPDIKIAVAY